MVVKREAIDALMEQCTVIVALTTQIVHTILATMLCLQQSIHITIRIPVHLLHIVRGKAHRDDTRSDVCEVEVEAVESVAYFFLGDECTYGGRDEGGCGVLVCDVLLLLELSLFGECE